MRRRPLSASRLPDRPRRDRPAVDFTGSSRSEEAGNLNAPPARDARPRSFTSSAVWWPTHPHERGLPGSGAYRPAGGVHQSCPYGRGLWPATWRRRSGITDALYGALGVLAAVAGHDEQPHLRQRAPTSTTRRSAAARAQGPASTAARGAHAHDQLAPHRPRGPGVALSGAAGRFRSATVRAATAASRRRRRHARAPLPRADDGRDPLQPPPPPFGLAGGEPGARGDRPVERADGSVECCGARPHPSVEMAAGDVFS